jgi:hypothetical protein
MRECFVQTRLLLTLRSDQNQTEEPRNAKSIVVTEEVKSDDPYTIGPDGWFMYDAGLAERAQDADRELAHRMLTARLKNIMRMCYYFPSIRRLNSP